uniref:Uncharacterized protein n=1 Tax=Arundo donax TaxID=35708 RepID=A0A0A8XZH2_ARUDO
MYYSNANLIKNMLGSYFNVVPNSFVENFFFPEFVAHIILSRIGLQKSSSGMIIEQTFYFKDVSAKSNFLFIPLLCFEFTVRQI